MRIARNVLILLLVMSLPVAALGIVDGRMPCEQEQSHTIGDQAAAGDLERSSSHVHAHPAQPGDGAAVDENFTAGSDHADRIARCTCGTDCDMTHCAGVNHTTAVLDPGHLPPVVTTSAAPARVPQLHVSTPPTTLLRPPITV